VAPIDPADPMELMAAVDPADAMDLLRTRA
jgi:hypothetical protein